VSKQRDSAILKAENVFLAANCKEAKQIASHL
jgi:hypothetical protein